MDKISKDEKYINTRLKTLVTKRNIVTLLKKVLVIILFIYFIINYIFAVYRMKDNSMNPTITEGELLFIYRLEKKYAIGDVVKFKLNNKNYVLRIIATEGQVVNIDEEGNVFVDDYPENYKAFYKTEIPENTNIKFPYIVEKNSVFVLEDCRATTNDSRVFGSVTLDKIEGKVISTFKVRNI